MASINTQTLVDANQNLSASIRALQAYIAGTVRSTERDIKELGDLTAHALLLVSIVADHSGAQSIDEMVELPLAEWPEAIRQIKGVGAQQGPDH